MSAVAERPQRNLVDVIDQLLGVIPLVDEYKSLRFELSSVQGSVRYAAPEMQRYWWGEVAEALNDYLNLPPQNEVDRAVDRIFSGGAAQ